MADQVSFKTRVLSTIIQCAKQYNAFYVEQNHLLVSDAFKKKPYYIIQAEKDNYLHLIRSSYLPQPSLLKNELADPILLH